MLIIYQQNAECQLATRVFCINNDLYVSPLGLLGSDMWMSWNPGDSHHQYEWAGENLIERRLITAHSDCILSTLLYICLL